MNSEVEDLFDAARRLNDPARRRAFLDAACHDHPELRKELEQLLALQPHAQALLDRGVAGFHPEAADLHPLTPADIASAALTERIGDCVGRYKLREKIGEGGCGVVYVADQEEPVRRRVALKVIKSGMDTKSVIARFDAERQALAMMDHPNIARVLDAGATETGRPYFVMELVRGIKITEFCDRNRLTTPQRLDLFVKVCQAVQHAHQKGVIHRDLKPSNILVTVNDGAAVPKIIDFGIAKATEGRLTDLTVYTELNQFIGTPAYMSPEQALMTSVDIDTRSDIYSLGVLLYELLTGRPPFETRELLTLGLDEMRRTIREKEPLRPSTRLSRLSLVELDTTANARSIEAPRLCSSVRGDLDWIVMKCLEKDRARRYATANDLASDLKRHLSSEPVIARPPSRLYIFQKTLRRNRVGFAATAAVMATLITAVMRSHWEAIRLKRAEQEQVRLRRQAEAESYTSDMSAAKQAWDEGDLQHAQKLLDSHRPKPGEPDLRGYEWRYLWNLFQVKSLKTIDAFRDDPVAILASSPAHMVVVVCCEKTIRLLDPKTGSELFRFTHPDVAAVNPVYAMALALGATNLLATHRANGVVTLWDLGARVQLGSFQAADAPSTAGGQFLALSPDGKCLAFAGAGSFSSQLSCWDISSPGHVPRQPLWSCEVTNGVVSLVFTPDGRILISSDSFRGNTLRTWDVKTGANGQPFPILSRGDNYALAVSGDGSLIAHAGFDARIHVRDLATRAWRFSLEGHSGNVRSLAFSPDGSRLISGGTDGTVRIWDIPSRQPIGMWPNPHNLDVNSVVYAPTGSSIFAASYSEVQVWSAEPESLQPIIETQDWGDSEISPNGRWLVTSDLRHSDGSAAFPAAKVWDMASRQQKFYLTFKNRHPLAMAFSPKGNLFALGDVEKEGVIGLWNTAAWETATSSVRPFRYLTNGFEAGSLRFSPDGNILASAGLEMVSDDPSGATNRLAFWQVGTWKRLNLLPGAGAAVNQWEAAATVDFSHDGRLLAVGHRDGRVRFWDFKRQRSLASFETSQNFNFGGAVVRFSGDGRWLVSFMQARRGLTLFELTDIEQPRVVLSANDPAGISGASFAPDNRSLVTVDTDGLLKFWNLQTRRVALTLRFSDTPGGGLAFAPDGNLLASRDSKGAVKLWTAPSLEEIDQQRKVK
jgi:serine/threonine protein kinase/WD40 repeat protein